MDVEVSKLKARDVWMIWTWNFFIQGFLVREDSHMDGEVFKFKGRDW